MKKLLIIFTAIFLSNQSALSQPLPADGINISKDLYVSNFLSINERIKINYPHLRNKNIKIDSLSEKYVSRIQKAESWKQYIKLLLEYFAELKNSHTILNLTPYVIDCSAKFIEKTLFIDRVEEEELKDAGVKKYDEIIEMDDIPAIEWLEKEKKYVCASTDHDRDNRGVWKVFRSEFESSRKYEIKTRDGVKTINVSFNKSNKYDPSNESVVIGSIIKDSIAYLNIASMRGNVVSDFLKQYEKIEKTPYLIIDIRGNDGRISRNSQAILSYLIKKKLRGLPPLFRTLC